MSRELDVDLAVGGVCAELVLESLSTFSSLVMLYLLSIGSFQPLCKKLPRRLSSGVGALASTLPAASHMPDRGLDSSSLVEALRNQPAIPPDEPVPGILFPVPRRVGLFWRAGSSIVVVEACHDSIGFQTASFG